MHINTVITKVGLRERNGWKLHCSSSVRWSGFIEENIPEKMNLPLELKMILNIWGQLGQRLGDKRRKTECLGHQTDEKRVGLNIVGGETGRVGWGWWSRWIWTSSCKEFGVGGANPLQELKMFFSILLPKAKQNRAFPLTETLRKLGLFYGRL